VSYGSVVTRDFVARYGSVREAEARARSVPAYAEEIQKVETRLAVVRAVARERTRPALDAYDRADRRETWFAPPELVSAELAQLLARRRDLIVAALAQDAEPLEHRGERAPASTAVSPPPRPPLPNESQINSFTYAKLQKAARAYRLDEATRGTVARNAKLPPTDARRVRLMYGADLLRLNSDEKLVVDDRVARKGSRYVLRYLDGSGTRWLDPIRELHGR
jgi:hypothetical protein